MDETGSEAREQQLKTSLFLSGAIPKLGDKHPEGWKTETLTGH
jgi:hypothetical protein